MSCTINVHFFFTCDECGKPREITGMKEWAVSELRKKGWSIRRKKREDPTYRIGYDNHYYYCPNCK